MNNYKEIEHLKKVDERLAKVIDHIGYLDLKSYNFQFDSFQFLVSEIVGQMISSKVRKIIFNRLLDLCDNNLTPQNISKLSIQDLRGIGLSQSKSKFIINLANLTITKQIDFSVLNHLSDDEVMKELKTIEGIGNWTAKMYLLFFLQRNDVLPFEDGAFIQAYKWLYNTKAIKPTSISRKCKKWKPYSSFGARYLYKALDNGLTKIPIKDFLKDIYEKA